MRTTTTEVMEEQHRAYRAGLRLNNGEPAQLGLYIARILRTQDLVAWQGDRAGFDKWLKRTICEYVNNCEAYIEPRQNGGAQ